MEAFSLTSIDLRTTIGDISVMPINFIYRRQRLDTLEHKHQFVEFHYILHGKLRFLMNDQEIILEDNDMLIICPDVKHSEYILDFEDQESICYSFSYSTQFKSETSSDLYHIFSYITHGKYYKKRITPNMLHIINSILREYSQHQLACQEILRLLISYLTIETLRVDINSVPEHFLPKNIRDNAEVIINEYFYNVFTGKEKGSVEELAKRLFISVRQLNRILQHTYGKNFSEMRLFHSLAGSAHLLSVSTLSVAQISDRMMYCSASAFCAAFKKFAGVSPSQYRKNPFKIDYI